MNYFEQKIYRYNLKTQKQIIYMFSFIIICSFLFTTTFYRKCLVEGRDLRAAIFFMILINLSIIIIGLVNYAYTKRFQIKQVKNGFEIRGLFKKRNIYFSEITRFNLRFIMGYNLMVLYLENRNKIIISSELENSEELFSYVKNNVEIEKCFQNYIRKWLSFFAVIAITFLYFLIYFVGKIKLSLGSVLNWWFVHLFFIVLLINLWQAANFISTEEGRVVLRRRFLKDIILPWQDIKERGKVGLEYERRFIWDIWVCTITLDNKKIVFDKLIDNGEELLKIVAEKTNLPFLNT